MLNKKPEQLAGKIPDRAQYQYQPQSKQLNKTEIPYHGSK